MKAAIYAVQRQPMCGLITVKPPMKGANNGPVKTVMEKTVIARPRERLSKISENTAATIAKGAEPKAPVKNRDINTVCRSLPTAVAMEKIEKPSMANVNGSFLPLSSERGAHKIGPRANPNTYRETPSTATSAETPN